jgi:hypothetical protein
LGSASLLPPLLLLGVEGTAGSIFPFALPPAERRGMAPSVSGKRRSGILKISPAPRGRAKRAKNEMMKTQINLDSILKIFVSL